MRRAPVILLALHALLSAFSAIALTTFLSGTPPAWLARPESQQALLIGWRFGPPLTVLFGALAALLHAAGKLGGKRSLMMFAVAFVTSLSAELLGTSTGFPFGPYSYTSILGYHIGGLVPFSIPTSWFYMLYASLAICGAILAPVEGNRRKWRWAFTAALVLTAWDISMDPAMVRTSHWSWHLSTAGGRSMFARVFLSDAFYGMPLLNWIGWVITGTIVARLMIVVVPTVEWVRLGTKSVFPIVLYLVNGVLPLAICVRYGMTWAAVLGAAGMLFPVSLVFMHGTARQQGAPRQPTASIPAEGIEAGAGARG